MTFSEHRDKKAGELELSQFAEQQYNYIPEGAKSSQQPQHTQHAQDLSATV